MPPQSLRQRPRSAREIMRCCWTFMSAMMSRIFPQRGDTYLQQALNIQGSGPDTAYQKGRIYYCLGETDNAKAMLASAVENEDADCLLLMGRVYLKLDDTSHARVMYQNYGEKYGETPESINGLVLCDIPERQL